MIPRGDRRFLLVFALVAAAIIGGPASAQEDTQPPVVADFSFTPSSVDTSTGDQTIAVTVRVTDDVAGLETAPSLLGRILFASPSGTTHVFAEVHPSHLVSGTPLDGTYMVTMVVSQFAEQGTWTLSSLFFQDRVGNQATLPAAAAAAAGFPTSFDQTGPGDTTPPVIAGFSFTPSSVNTSTSDQTITVTVRVTDDVAGLQTASSLLGRVLFASPSGTTHVFAEVQPFHLVSGTPLDGTYVVTMVVPRFAEQGTWTLSGIFFQDRASNHATLSAAAAAAAGFPTSFDQTGPGDTTPPVIAGFSFTPSSVDTSTSDQTITVTVRVTDDVAGLETAPSLLGRVLFASPSGTTHVFAEVQPFHLVSGTPLDGTYVATMVVPHFAEQGTWTLSSLFFQDRVGNHATLSAADVAAAGFPTSFENGASICCNVEVTVSPTSARRGQTVKVTALVQNSSAMTQPVTVAFKLSSPFEMALGSFRLTLAPNTAFSKTVPFRIPRNAPLGQYSLGLTTTTTSGMIVRTATLVVLP